MLTAIEKECQETLYMVRECLAPRWSAKTSRQDFMALMTHIKDAIIHLKNKEFGCASGRHACPCSCTIDTPGRYVRKAQ